VKKGDVLVFSEGYDKGWAARLASQQVESHKVESRKYHNRFNSFVLPEDGSYSLEVYYGPQKWVDIGIWISAATLIAIAFLVIKLSGYKVIK
jgi:hypothetical protein